MAIQFSSAGVTTTEIDVSFPGATVPTGVPAGIIGTAVEGPAFVPVTVANWSDWQTVFGASDGKKFGPLAVYFWLKNANAVTYVRVLGAGDCKKKDASSGAVTNAGFTVGQEIVQANGNVAQNPKAVAGGMAGRTYFLGAYMSESNGSTVFSSPGTQAGQTLALTSSVPVLRAVLFAPDNVVLRLSGSRCGASSAAGGGGEGTQAELEAQASTAIGPYGGITGSLVIGSQEFVMLLNGHIHTDSYPNIITASLDTTSNSYFGDVFNTDPFKIEDAGHVLYTRYDIHPNIATVTGTGIINNQSGSSAGAAGVGMAYEDIVFLTTGSLSRASGNATTPDYESFTDRFKHASTPWFMSQDFGGTKHNIFKIHALSAGASANTKFKISIEGLTKAQSDTYTFGTFDLIVRNFYDTDETREIIEEFRGLSLDPSSDSFIARKIGDQNTYFDFDRATASQKIVVDGDHPNMSLYIRVEQSTGLLQGIIPDNTLPIGFRGPMHLMTSGSDLITDITDGTMAGGGNTATAGFEYYEDANTGNTMLGSVHGARLRKMKEPAIPFRENVADGLYPNKFYRKKLYWGVQWEMKVDPERPNLANLVDPSIESYTKYFPTWAESNVNVSVGNNAGATDIGTGGVRDSDLFNHNMFTLERIKVRTGSGTDSAADVDQWVSASYVRDGTITANNTTKTRAWKIDDLEESGNKTFSKFTVLLQGGFDGVNILDEDKAELTNVAARREMTDSTQQGGKLGPTVAAYRKALDVLGSKTDADIQLLTVPGQRHTSVTDYAVDTAESRFDAVFIMDIDDYDTVNTVVTSSVQVVDVTNTVTNFRNRALDTSFAAAYFPDIVVTDPSTGNNLRVPPSVAVIGAYSQNDAIGHPWFAPAGFTRGVLNDVLFATVDLNKDNLDKLYDADINPLTDFPGSGMVVWGQKTLMANASSLDRVNVRRLLIAVRRSVRAIANTLLFEPNRSETLEKFSSLVNPVLQSIQAASGLDRYKVIIDTSTTTQADVENNTIRGKIFLQPTRTAEFISLDFVVTNAGNEI